MVAQRHFTGFTHLVLVTATYSHCIIVNSIIKSHKNFSRALYDLLTCSWRAIISINCGTCIPFYTSFRVEHWVQCVLLSSRALHYQLNALFSLGTIPMSSVNFYRFWIEFTIVSLLSIKLLSNTFTWQSNKRFVSYITFLLCLTLLLKTQIAILILSHLNSCR